MEWWYFSARANQPSANGSCLFHVLSHVLPLASRCSFFVGGDDEAIETLIPMIALSQNCRSFMQFAWLGLEVLTYDFKREACHLWLRCLIVPSLAGRAGSESSTRYKRVNMSPPMECQPILVSAASGYYVRTLLCHASFNLFLCVCNCPGNICGS